MGAKPAAAAEEDEDGAAMEDERDGGMMRGGFFLVRVGRAARDGDALVQESSIKRGGSGCVVHTE